jgi:hypothetical protein
MTYRTAPAAQRDHAAMRALSDGADWPPTIDARAERVEARSRTFRAMCAAATERRAFEAFDADPSAANLTAYLDARDELRRVSKETDQ